MTAVKPHILSISRELTTGGAELDAEAMKTRRGRAWLYYRHLLARDSEMSDQSSLARSVRIIDGTESVIDGQGTTNPGQQEEEQESNLRAPLRRPEFDPVLSPEEVAAWHARSFLNEPAKRAITVPPDHPDADSLARWLDVESININLEPTQPDLPSGIDTYRVQGKEMQELIQNRLMADLGRYCEDGKGWESMPNLQPGEEALRRTRSAGRLPMRFLYRVLFDTVLDALGAEDKRAHTFALLATLRGCNDQNGHGDDPKPDRYSGIFAIQERSINFALEEAEDDGTRKTITVDLQPCEIIIFEASLHHYGKGASKDAPVALKGRMSNPAKGSSVVDDVDVVSFGAHAYIGDKDASYHGSRTKLYDEHLYDNIIYDYSRCTRSQVTRISDTTEDETGSDNCTLRLHGGGIDSPRPVTTMMEPEDHSPPDLLKASNVLTDLCDVMRGNPTAHCATVGCKSCYGQGQALDQEVDLIELRIKSLTIGSLPKLLPMRVQRLRGGTPDEPDSSVGTMVEDASATADGSRPPPSEITRSSDELPINMRLISRAEERAMIARAFTLAERDEEELQTAKLPTDTPPSSLPASPPGSPVPPEETVDTSEPVEGAPEAAAEHDASGDELKEVIKEAEGLEASDEEPYVDASSPVLREMAEERVTDGDATLESIAQSVKEYKKASGDKIAKLGSELEARMMSNDAALRSALTDQIDRVIATINLEVARSSTNAEMRTKNLEESIEDDKKTVSKAFAEAEARIRGLEENLTATNKVISDVDQSVKATARGLHESLSATTGQMAQLVEWMNECRNKKTHGPSDDDLDDENEDDVRASAYDASLMNSTARGSRVSFKDDPSGMGRGLRFHPGTPGWRTPVTRTALPHGQPDRPAAPDVHDAPQDRRIRAARPPMDSRDDHSPPTPFPSHSVTMENLGMGENASGKYLLFIVAHSLLAPRDGASSEQRYSTRAYANNALDAWAHGAGDLIQAIEAMKFADAAEIYRWANRRLIYPIQSHAFVKFARRTTVREEEIEGIARLTLGVAQEHAHAPMSVLSALIPSHDASTLVELRTISNRCHEVLDAPVDYRALAVDDVYADLAAVLQKAARVAPYEAPTRSSSTLPSNSYDPRSGSSALSRRTQWDKLPQEDVYNHVPKYKDRESIERFHIRISRWVYSPSTNNLQLILQEENPLELLSTVLLRTIPEEGAIGNLLHGDQTMRRILKDYQEITERNSHWVARAKSSPNNRQYMGKLRNVICEMLAVLRAALHRISKAACLETEARKFVDLVSSIGMENGERNFIARVSQIFETARSLWGGDQFMDVCENGWMRNFLPDFVKRLQPETQRRVYKYVDDLTRTLESMAREPDLNRTPFTTRVIKALQTRGTSQTLTPWYDDAAVIDGCIDYNDLVLFEKHTNTSMKEFLSPSDLNWFANAGLLELA